MATGNPLCNWYENLMYACDEAGIEDIPDGKEYYEKLVKLKRGGKDPFFVIEQDDPTDIEILMALLRGVHKLIERTSRDGNAMVDYCATVEGWICHMLCEVVEMEVKR
ncbi:MAG: hypothetical protein KAS32_19310 [Candidatus Peribacteraceae bacterium]|nr:hypothetical protein [Candidatus Peribacteraceae bacterium]